MFKNRNKFLFCLLFLAVSSFIFLSVGGEFLHSQIHHHQTQASHDQCPVYQLQAQVSVALSAIVFALFLPIVSRLIKKYQKFVFQSLHNLPYLRAPPLSLS